MKEKLNKTADELLDSQVRNRFDDKVVEIDI